MTVIERKVNVYKLFIAKNLLNAKNASREKLKSVKIKESTKDKESDFESKIQKIFQQKKFFINNQYDHQGVENFLKEKDECLKKMELNDSILYKSSNEQKKSKSQKKKFKNHDNLNSIDIKKKIKIENNNQIVVDSFISNESGECIEEILELLN